MTSPEAGTGEAGSRRGWFIAFEGGEGSGKSTQARLLAERIDAILTREPGGTPVGARLRGLLLAPETGQLDPRAEALLMVADRAQHVAEVVAPALALGRHVVTDRYAGSTLAYQGWGRGLDTVQLAELSSWATGGLAPDLVVLLDLAPDAARLRLGQDLDRVEQAGASFHQRVREGFLDQAAASGGRWVVLDATLPVAEVAAAVSAAVADRLGPVPPR